MPSTPDTPGGLPAAGHVPTAADHVSTAAHDLPRAAPITARALQFEVVVVVALSLGASAAYAIVDLVRGVVVALQRHQSLAAQTAVLYGSADVHPYLDLTYQLLGIAVELVPVVLVIHLLGRTSEHLSTLGIDGRCPRRDLRRGVALAVLVGAAGLGALALFHAMGADFSLAVGSTRRYWWTIPVLVLQAAGTAVEEEVIVGAYLLHRLDQAGWSDGRALAAGAVLRGAYHLYQGPGQFVSNAVLGLFFGRLYQRTRRAMPLVVAHFLIDAVAFVGYVILRGHVSWLP